MISFREKSLWVSLLVSIVIMFSFGESLYHFLLKGENVNLQDSGSLIIQMVIAFVVLEIALHIALAMSQQEDANLPEDERGRNYRLLANNVGYWVLSIGVVSCIAQQMINNSIDIDVQNTHLNFALAPIELKLVAIFWASEITRFATELYYYRKES